ncbi:Zn-ribbon domain-containing OB-fold protein [Nocardia sp. NPDC059180]|uniref:Zn-ribbon domain-containing OB-fold protein n=1 Tax=Nocardia sp. NPDC059180 TaxID=3346761 RepID=UPI0036AF0546
MCSACGRSLSAVPSSGAGWIVSCSVVDCAPPGCAHLVPRMMAIVQLDDGPWMYAWIDAAPTDRWSDPIRVRFDHDERGERYPVFVRCAA